MHFKAKIQCTIHASVSQVWDALTKPELVAQYFFGTKLITSWEPGTAIFFEGEWEGTAYQDKGTVLKYEAGQMLQYDYFSSWSDQADVPENYQTITYRVKAKGNSTVLIVTQNRIESLEKKIHSAQNWAGVIGEMKKKLESGQLS